MKLILLSLFLIIYCYGNCVNVPSSYNISVPYDYGVHANYSYEYWMYEALVKAENKTFGILLGVTRCSNKCLAWNNSSIQFALSISVKEEDVLIKNIEYWETPDFYVDSNLNPYNLNIGLNGVRAKFKNNWDALQLTAFIQNVYVDLNLLSINKDPAFVNDIGKLSTGVHVPQTHFIVSGNVIYNNKIYDVMGTGYNDHYFSNVTCGNVNNARWKWFVLTLSNYEFLLVTVVYDNYGIYAQHLMIIHPDGTYNNTHTFKVYTTKYWISPNTGIKYPIHNRIIWSNIVDLEVIPNVDNNELFFLQTPIIYEGVSFVKGYYMDQPVTGMGTTELKGY